MKRIHFLFFLGVTGLAFLVAGCSAQKTAASFPVQDVTILKSQACGCCSVFTKYMTDQGFTVNGINVQDPAASKAQYGIPSSMESCHTTIMGDYFVEGHVPVEAMQKLMMEKPDIKGIAMPGMPYGSPGMPGSKQGPFVIYAIDRDGSITEFMKM